MRKLDLQQEDHYRDLSPEEQENAKAYDVQRKTALGEEIERLKAVASTTRARILLLRFLEFTEHGGLVYGYMHAVASRALNATVDMNGLQYFPADPFLFTSAHAVYHTLLNTLSDQYGLKKMAILVDGNVLLSNFTSHVLVLLYTYLQTLAHHSQDPDGARRSPNSPSSGRIGKRLMSITSGPTGQMMRDRVMSITRTARARSRGGSSAPLPNTTEAFDPGAALDASAGFMGIEFERTNMLRYEDISAAANECSPSPCHRFIHVGGGVHDARTVWFPRLYAPTRSGAMNEHGEGQKTTLWSRICEQGGDGEDEASEDDGGALARGSGTQHSGEPNGGSGGALEDEHEEGLLGRLLVYDCGRCSVLMLFDEWVAMGRSTHHSTAPGDAHIDAIAVAKLCADLHSHLDAELKELASNLGPARSNAVLDRARMIYVNGSNLSTKTFKASTTASTSGSQASSSLSSSSSSSSSSTSASSSSGGPSAPSAASASSLPQAGLIDPGTDGESKVLQWGVPMHAVHADLSEEANRAVNDIHTMFYAAKG